ncbi:hypothetical protein ACFWEK_17000, partial [Isoptericola sp. NPDC060257]
MRRTTAVLTPVCTAVLAIAALGACAPGPASSAASAAPAPGTPPGVSLAPPRGPIEYKQGGADVQAAGAADQDGG